MVGTHNGRSEGSVKPNTLPLAERDWVDGLHRVMPAAFDLPESAAGAAYR